MNILGVVDVRNKEVRWGLALFLAGILAFVASLNLLFVVWLGGEPMLGSDSLSFMGWISGIILVASLIQLLRFTRDGRRISASLGGVPLSQFAGVSAKAKDKAVQLQNIVDELAIAAGCRSPALYIQKGRDELNGFACGIRPDHWCITVTEGCVKRLTRDEMQALIAHELAHLTSGDTRNSILVCAYVAGLTSLALVGLLLAAAMAGKSKEGAAVALVGVVIAVTGGVGVIAANLLEARLSRRQEFRADAEGVRLTRHGDGMVALLVRLAEESYGPQAKSGGWDVSWDGFCARPLNFGRSVKSFWFDSHPPLIDRIRVFDPAAAEKVENMISGRI